MDSNPNSGDKMESLLLQEGSFADTYSGLEAIGQESFLDRDTDLFMVEPSNDWLGLEIGDECENEPKMTPVCFSLEDTNNFVDNENVTVTPAVSMPTGSLMSMENVTSTDSSKATPKSRKTSPSTGIKAVQAAKKKAQEIATKSADQRRERKRSAGELLGEPKRQKLEDGSTDEENDPEAMKQIRHERRLQKNRDTAYISRIRRRVYTKQLEESLIRSENAKTDLENENLSLRAEMDKFRSEVENLRGRASDASRSVVSSVPSESEGERLEKISDAGSSGSAGHISVLDFFQDIMTPITPRVEVCGPTMRATMFVFVLLFGLFAPGSHERASAGNGSPCLYQVDSLKSGHLSVGQVWDPCSVSQSDLRLLSSGAHEWARDARPGPSGVQVKEEPSMVESRPKQGEESTSKEIPAPSQTTAIMPATESKSLPGFPLSVPTKKEPRPAEGLKKSLATAA